MSPILHLDYVCSHAELEQAQSLSLRHQLGGGSKWRTRFVLVVLLVGILSGAWFRFREIPEGYPALILAAIIGCCLFFAVCIRRFRKTIPRPIQLEISEEGLTILGTDSKVALPWSAFAQCLESSDLFVLLDRPKRTLIVLPKRVFPSANWQAWFHEQTHNLPSLEPPAWSELPVPPSTSADLVTFTVRLRYRDSLARTVASWRTWGICFALGALWFGTGIYVAAQPAPDAVNSPTKVIVVFAVPFFLVAVAMIVTIFSVHAWRLDAKYSGAREIALFEQSIAFSGTDGSGMLPWSSFKYYKETPWSFILWAGSHWMIFPKRVFTSWDDIGRCRDLLERHLKRSRWFVG
jgi:hypothetical protein